MQHIPEGIVRGSCFFLQVNQGLSLAPHARVRRDMLHEAHYHDMTIEGGSCTLRCPSASRGSERRPSKPDYLTQRSHMPGQAEEEFYWQRRAQCDRRSGLHLRLLGDLQRIIDLDPEVADGAFQLRVPEQQLNGPEIPGSPVDQRCLGAPQRMRAIGCRI